MIRAPRRSRRGLTLIELMVGTAIGLFIVAAAVTFVVHQNLLLEFTSREIDRDRTGRVALDILSQDLRHAGVGVGYGADDTFRGLMLGTFSVHGGATFNSDDEPIVLTSLTANAAKTYPFFTDDIGMRLANGDRRSIVMFGPGVGQVCRGGEYEPEDIVLLTSEDGIDARTVRILSFSRADACTHGSCVNGCDFFTWAIDDSFYATDDSISADYQGGEMAGGYQELVWFVEQGDLRRAQVSATRPCTSRATCGGIVASGVETMQMRIWQWDPEADAWEDRTPFQTLLDRRRIRIDVELVVRLDGRKPFPHSPVELELEPGSCLPACGVSDYVARRALRLSVEVRNSGRMELGGKS